MLKVLFTIIHVLVSIFLILVVLLQTGKRADLAGAFGGGGSQTAFGARGTATVLSKLTTACAATFMITSIALVILSRGESSQSSVLDEVQAPAPIEQSAPVTPAPQPLPSLPAPEPSDQPSGEVKNPDDPLASGGDAGGSGGGD